MKFNIAVTERMFVYNFVSSRTRYLNLVSFPPEIDTPDLSNLRVDIILYVKYDMAAHP